jgi:arginine-tRNA-protein transferase
MPVRADLAGLAGLAAIADLARLADACRHARPAAAVAGAGRGLTMARQLRHYVDPPSPCDYLPGQVAELENRIIVGGTADELEAMIVRGWRRFGPVHFRPACGGCGECVSLRLPVADFRPSVSQRRAARACASLRSVVGPPLIDDQRLALYRAWHRQREATRDWAPSPINPRAYELQFAFPHPAVREIAYYDDDAAGGGGRLVGLGICDVTPRVWSAVYFFYDPAYARRSLGVANVLRQVEAARAQGVPHVYLGYRILGCASMRYKAGFQPHELLVGRPTDDEPPRWQRGPAR